MKFEKIENSPFTIYGNEEEGYSLLMGKYRFCENKTFEEVMQMATEVNYNTIMQMVICIIKENETNKF